MAKLKGLKTMRYDPNKAPDPKAWLALDEGERIKLAADFHRKAKIKLPNLNIHAIAHHIVENQVALGDEYVVAAKLDQLMKEGLSRHDAIHAIGSVLMANVFDIQKGVVTGEVNEKYAKELAELTARKWLDEF